MKISIFILRLVLIAGITIGIIYTYKAIDRNHKTNDSVLSAETKKSKPIEKSLLEKISNDPIVKKAVEYAQSTYKNVLGESTDTIIKSAVSEIMKQVDKLPEGQKEEIKKEICK